MIVARDGIDLNNFSQNFDKAEVRKKLDCHLIKKIVMYIGRLDGWKGVETLFAASKLLPEVHFAIIGGEIGQIARFKKNIPIFFFGPAIHTENLRKIKWQLMCWCCPIPAKTRSPLILLLRLNFLLIWLLAVR